MHIWVCGYNLPREKVPAFLKSHQWAKKREDNRFRVPIHFATDRFTFEKFPPPPHCYTLPYSFDISNLALSRLVTIATWSSKNCTISSCLYLHVHIYMCISKFLYIYIYTYVRHVCFKSPRSALYSFYIWGGYGQ